MKELKLTKINLVKPQGFFRIQKYYLKTLTTKCAGSILHTARLQRKKPIIASGSPVTEGNVGAQVAGSSKRPYQLANLSNKKNHKAGVVIVLNNSVKLSRVYSGAPHAHKRDKTPADENALVIKKTNNPEALENKRRPAIQGAVPTKYESSPAKGSLSGRMVATGLGNKFATRIVSSGLPDKNQFLRPWPVNKPNDTLLSTDRSIRSETLEALADYQFVDNKPWHRENFNSNEYVKKRENIRSPQAHLGSSSDGISDHSGEVDTVRRDENPNDATDDVHGVGEVRGEIWLDKSRIEDWLEVFLDEQFDRASRSIGGIQAVAGDSVLGNY